MAKKSYPTKRAQVPVTYAQLEEVRFELKSEISGLREEMRAEFKRVDARFNDLEARFSGIDERFDKMEARFSGIDARFNEMEARFSGIDARFNEMEARFNAIDARFDRLEASVAEVKSEVHKISAAIHAMLGMMEQQHSENRAALDGYAHVSEEQRELRGRVEKLEAER